MQIVICIVKLMINNIFESKLGKHYMENKNPFSMLTCIPYTYSINYTETPFLTDCSKNFWSTIRGEQNWSDNCGLTASNASKFLNISCRTIAIAIVTL